MRLHSGETLMGITWWLVAMTTIAISLRFYARAIGRSHVALDDWMMLVAWVLILASQVLLTIVYGYGLGQTDDLTMSQMMSIFKFQWIYVIPANLSSIFSRVSIAILLSRIFSVKRWFRWYLIITTTIAGALVITLLVELWTSCDPISALWNPVIRKTAKCLDPNIFSDIGFASQGMLTLTDITFVLFPVIFIWKLNMAMKKKIGLLLVFCLGLLTAAASIMKMVLVQSTSKQQDIASTIPALIWSTAEAALVIIIGCIPTLGPLTKIQLPNLRYRSGGSLPLAKSTAVTESPMVSTSNNVPEHSVFLSHPRQYYKLKSGLSSPTRSIPPQDHSQASSASLGHGLQE